MTDDQQAPPDDLTLLRFASIALKRRDAIIRGMVAGVVLGLGAALLWPRSYESTAAFIPQAQSMPGGLGDLAAQFGFALPTASPTESPDFYADLLRSRRVAVGVLDHTYQGCDPSPCRLAEALDVSGDSPEETLERALEELRDRSAIDVQFKSQIVRVTARMPDPLLAQEVASRYLALVAEFNQHVRQSQASEESRFTAERVEVLRGELGAAVDRLRRFLESNHDYRASPRLVFEYEALERDVNVRQTLLTQVLQAHEQARIEKVRNTPVLTVVDEPQVPGEPADRRFALIALGSMLLGAIVALTWALWGDLRRDPGSPQMTEFADLVDATLTDMRHPLRAGSRLVGRG